MKIGFKAILAGWLVFYLGQWLVNKIVLAVFIVLAMDGSTNPAKLKTVMAALRVSTPLHLIQLGTQTLFLLAAAYLAVRIAKRAPLEHSLLLGFLCLASTVYFAFDTFSLWPLWYSILTVFLNVPLALLGGFWSAQKLDLRFRDI